MVNEIFAVIDVETTWTDKVMSIGVVLASDVTFQIVGEKYYIITPECNEGGLFSNTLELEGLRVDMKGSRARVIQDLLNYLESMGVRKIFSYTTFDYRHLSELHDYSWYDISKRAAYKQYNLAIPDDYECCASGRLKRDYGVEPMYKLLMGCKNYVEKHNAYYDSLDELMIMKALEYSVDEYD